MDFILPKTPEEYIQFVQIYAGLTDAELTKAENADAHDAMLRIPGLISLVNVIGYLRGQDGFFLESRPQRLAEKQQLLYDLEDSFEKRLRALIEKVLESDEAAQLEQAVQAYYVTNRLHP